MDEFNKSQGFSLSYPSPKVRDNNTKNKATGPANMPNSHEEGVISINMNMCLPQGLDSSSIPYEENQPTKLRLWDGTALPISLFGTNEFIDIDMKNISTSLLQIADYIQSKAL